MLAPSSVAPMLLWMIGLFLTCQTLKAQNSAASSVPVKLLGRAVKTADILSKSESIFVGQIADLGYPSLASPDVASYSARVKVLQILRGSVDSQIWVRIDVNGRDEDDVPMNRGSYIFFVKKASGQNKALKLLQATDDNIAKVKALIAAAPTGK